MTTATAPQTEPTPVPPADPLAAPDGPQTPGADPGAPFGRTPSGRPRSKPLSGRRGRPKGRRTSRTSVIGATGSRSKAAPKGPVDYRPTILRTAQMLLIPLSFRAPIDAFTVTAGLEGEDTPANPGFARALSNVAGEYPQVAAVLEKLAAAGPIGDLVGTGLPIMVQLLVNHKRLPVEVGQKLGAMDPALIEQHLQARGEAMAAAA